MCEKIDEVTPETVRKVAFRIFGPGNGRKPTVVTMGRKDISDWQRQLKKYGVGF